MKHGRRSSRPRFRLRDFIDQLMMWLKWPAAICSLLILPGAIVATTRLLTEVARSVADMWMFLGGAAVYTLVWMAVLRRSRFSFFMTLEHELTHILFAILSFHRVTNLKVTMTRGGVMEFQGRGNWLITIAPYFVPLTSLTLILIHWIVMTRVEWWMEWGDALNVLIGASFAYHLTSKAHQTHPGQSDLKKVGMTFSWLFLPSAILLASGLVVAFAQNGATAVANYFEAVWDTTRVMLAGES